MRREHGYALVIGIAGCLLLIVVLLYSQPRPLLAVAAFAAYGMLAEVWPANLRAGTVSVEAAFLIPSAVLTGPAGAALALATSVFAASLIKRRPLRVGIFNAGQYAIAVLVAARLTDLWFGPVFSSRSLDVGPLAVFFAVFLLINHLIVDSYFLLAGFNWQSAVLDGLGLDVMASVVTLPLGMAVVVAFREYLWVGVFGIATPLVLLGYALHLQIDMRQRNRNLELLHAFYREFAEAGDVPAILRALRDRLEGVFQNSVGFAGVVDGRQNLLPLPGSEFTPGPEAALRAAAAGKEFALTGEEAKEVLAPGSGGGMLLPVVTTQGLVGLVAFAWPYELRVDAGDMALFAAARQIATIACEKEALLRETERLAATDPRLPGLYNYRYLIMRLDEGLARNRAEGRRLALIYIDLDDFKKFNDQLGHLAGDEVLREFANILAGHTRQGDVAARYAGDEFVLLLADADRAQAEEVALRLRAEVEGFRFLTGFEVGKAPTDLSFSYGISCDEGGREDARSMIDAADRAMYADKRRKRLAR